MKEGSLEAPTRHPLNWDDPEFYDAEKIDEEIRRVFDVCHGCRRCFNLCNSFPTLFDLIDESESGEVDGLNSGDIKQVVDDCTLCDMCFMAKCPYVPPHEFNIDFPHLMLRYRAAEFKRGEVSKAHQELVKTDRNNTIASGIPNVVNWATKPSNKPIRFGMEKVAGIHRKAALPKFQEKTLVMQAKKTPEVNTKAPAYGRKAVLYATCHGNYNNPNVGVQALNVLSFNGVETEVVYPGCCGMPQLEQGNIPQVAKNAEAVSKELCAWVDKGYDVIALMPSCALMLKFEWPLLVQDNPNITKLSRATYDLSEYIVDIAKKDGLADGLGRVQGGVSMHLACHSRAQNMGPKAAEMLGLIPDIDMEVIERCSGHGGSWGVMKENFETALKVGQPVTRKVAHNKKAYIASECPLAGDHIVQGLKAKEGDQAHVEQASHPIEILAKAYGF